MYMRKFILINTLFCFCSLLYAQSSENIITDVLTSNLFSGGESNNYIQSNYTSPLTQINYSAYNAKSNNSIQLNTSSQKSGIVSTSSNYVIDKVIIDWYYSTGNSGKCLDVYAKSTSYSNPSDLYNDSECGTLLGSIDYSVEPCTLDISGDYKYIGLRSKSNTIYINSIRVLYKSDLQIPNSSFEKSEITLGLSDICENIFTTNSDGQISYSSSNTDVATVDNNGNVTPIKLGETIITATTTKTDKYIGSSASYKLIVTEDAVVWEEDFNNASSNLLSNSSGASIMTDNNYSGGFLPELMINEDKYFNVSIPSIDSRHVYFLNFKSNHFNYISVKSSTTGTNIVKEDNLDSYKYRITLADGTDSLNLKFTNNYSGNSRVDDFILRAGYVRELTEGNIGTLCLPFAIKEIHGADLYSIIGKRVDGEGNVKSVVFEEVTENFEAGVPYVFKATANEMTIVYKGDVVYEPLNSNGLIGTFSATDVEEGYYILSGNTIQKCGTGCVAGANRAFIDMNSVPEYNESNNSKRRLEINGSGIVNSIDNVVFSTQKVDVYNVCGVKIRSGVDINKATSGFTKGLYIVGNKKVIVR